MRCLPVLTLLALSTACAEQLAWSEASDAGEEPSSDDANIALYADELTNQPSGVPSGVKPRNSVFASLGAKILSSEHSPVLAVLASRGSPAGDRQENGGDADSGFEPIRVGGASAVRVEARELFERGQQDFAAVDLWGDEDCWHRQGGMVGLPAISADGRLVAVGDSAGCNHSAILLLDRAGRVLDRLEEEYEPGLFRDFERQQSVILPLAKVRRWNARFEARGFAPMNRLDASCTPEAGCPEEQHRKWRLDGDLVADLVHDRLRIRGLYADDIARRIRLEPASTRS